MSKHKGSVSTYYRGCRCDGCKDAYETDKNDPKNKERRRAATRRWQRKDGGHHYLNAQLKFKFCLSVEEYQDILTKQDGKCAICHQDETFVTRWGTVASLAVDHCHETDKVRGLLCRRCNQAIGKFNDDPDLLQKAVDYLKKEW